MDAAVQPCPGEPIHTIHIEFQDYFGEALESSYILEHPDGEMEPGQLDGGIIHREVTLLGDYKVHLPELLEVSLDTEALDLGPSGSSPEIEVTLEYRGFGRPTDAVFTFLRELDEDEAEASAVERAVLGEVREMLAADGPQVEAGEVRVRWPLDGVEGLPPGTACRVLCHVKAENLEIESSAVAVYGPAPDEPE